MSRRIDSLVNQISLELQDVFHGGEEGLFALIEAPRLLDDQQLRERIGRTNVPADKHTDLIQLLLWYGVIGILRHTGEETYIYSVNYEMKILSALINNRPTAAARLRRESSFLARLSHRYQLR